MDSAEIYYGVGIFISVLNVVLLSLVLRSQLKQFNKIVTNNPIKRFMMGLTVAALLSNVIPVWFDIYQIIHHTHPTNIGVAYTSSHYLFRTVAALMLYLIYRF